MELRTNFITCNVINVVDKFRWRMDQFVNVLDKIQWIMDQFAPHNKQTLLLDIKIFWFVSR